VVQEGIMRRMIHLGGSGEYNEEDDSPGWLRRV
jgi:hypothetical protein